MNPNAGKTFSRYVKALAVARGEPSAALAYASSQNWSNASQVAQSIKAAISATGGSDVGISSPAEFDFAEFIRPLTLIGKLVGLRRVPSRTRVIAATSGSTAYWAGERAPRAISRATFTGSVVEPLSVTAMLVTTLELLRSSAPSAESILSRDLAAAAVSAMDSAFIDPANTGTAGVKPTSISNGVTPIHSVNSTLVGIDADLAAMITALTDAGSDLQFAAWVMAPRTALYLARQRGSGGVLAHPGMTARGGVLLGLPCVTSASVPTSPTASITLLDAGQILVADDGGSVLEILEQTALQMSDSPGAGATSLVSLWQTDSAALRVGRHANWMRCRDGVVAVLDQVPY